VHFFAEDIVMQNFTPKWLLVFSLLALGSSAWADKNTVLVGRYLTVKNKPSLAQTDLLSQTIQVRFPQRVQTIGDAMDYLLRFSGYSLIAPPHRSSALQILLSKPLPLVDRDFGPMPLKEALTTLAGPAFYLTQDSLNRQVNFKVKSHCARKCVVDTKMPPTR
jgi:type IV pili sensor histidine kinase/response regulator